MIWSTLFSWLAVLYLKAVFYVLLNAVLYVLLNGCIMYMLNGCIMYMLNGCIKYSVLWLVVCNMFNNWCIIQSGNNN